MNKTTIGLLIALVGLIGGYLSGTPDPLPLRESKTDVMWKSEFPPPNMKDQLVYDGVIDGFFLDEKWSVDIMQKVHPASSFSMSSNGATVEYLVIEENGKTWAQVVKKGEQLNLTSRPGKLFCRVEKHPSRSEMWPRLIIVVTAPQRQPR